MGEEAKLPSNSPSMIGTSMTSAATTAPVEQDAEVGPQAGRRRTKPRADSG